MLTLRRNDRLGAIRDRLVNGTEVQVFQRCAICPGGDGVAEVALSYDHLAPDWTGSFDAVAVLWWGAGGFDVAPVEIDIPAGGVIFTAPAADALEVSVRAEGTSVDAVARVRATMGVVDARHPRPVHRTTAIALPGASSTITRIPAFARGFWMSSNDAADSAVVIEVLRQRTAGAGDVLAQVLFAEGAFVPLPLGADSYRVVGPASAATIRTIWELAL